MHPPQGTSPVSCNLNGSADYLICLRLVVCLRVHVSLCNYSFVQSACKKNERVCVTGMYTCLFLSDYTHREGTVPRPHCTPCKAETLSGGRGAEHNHIKAVSPHTSASAANLIYCSKLIHSNMVDIWYNLPPTTIQARAKILLFCCVC